MIRLFVLALILAALFNLDRINLVCDTEPWYSTVTEGSKVVSKRSWDRTECSIRLRPHMER
jgi:hypothetical protein